MLTLQEFVRQRNEVLPSLDEQRIRTLYAKFGTELPTDPEVFWGSVHKAITAIPSLPIEVRRQSKAWLDQRGWQSFDEGEL